MKPNKSRLNYVVIERVMGDFQTTTTFIKLLQQNNYNFFYQGHNIKSPFFIIKLLNAYIKI